MNKKGSTLVVVISIIALLAVAGAAYFYGQNQGLIGKVSYASPSSISSVTSPSATPLASGATATPAPVKATVVFEAEGSFSQGEKDELKKKVIDPFVDYYTTESDQVLLTLTIAKNSQASKDNYPYTSQAIFKGGGTMGFLVMKQGTGVDWWFPECMVSCNLSASYKAKYPEIAAKVQ